MATVTSTIALGLRGEVLLVGLQGWLLWKLLEALARSDGVNASSADQGWAYQWQC